MVFSCSPPRGPIEEVSEEPPEQPEAPGDPGDDGGDDGGGDDGGGDDDPDPDSKPKPYAADPIPNPNLNAEADGKAQVGRLLVALERLAENAGGNRPATSKANLRDPDPFDGKDSKKLRGFLLQCKLNFQAKPEYFRDYAVKVTYALSFLKEPALDYFEPFLVDNTKMSPHGLPTLSYSPKSCIFTSALTTSRPKPKSSLNNW
jgi:hypothetical protein